MLTTRLARRAVKHELERKRQHGMPIVYFDVKEKTIKIMCGDDIITTHPLADGRRYSERYVR